MTPQAQTLLTIIAKIDQTMATVANLQSQAAALIDVVALDSALAERLREACNDLERQLSQLEQIILRISR